MGWSIGFDANWNRDVGYGVPAWCDYPGCDEEIDRGLSHVCCGEEPYGGDGCGLYFCGKHHDEWDEEVDVGGMCERCANGEDPFEPKPEHPRWIKHKMTHPSWATWRAGQKTEAEGA